MDIVHFYRKTVDNKPYQSLSLNHGFILIDPLTSIKEQEDQHL